MKMFNNNWKTLVVIVFMTFTAVIGWSGKWMFNSVIQRLDMIEKQTRELPAIRQQVQANREFITQNSDDIRELRRTKRDKE